MRQVHKGEGVDAGAMHKPDMKSNIMLLAGLLLTALLLIYPVRALLGAYSYGSVEMILDNPETDFQDTLGISAETLPVYHEAVDKLERAVALVPSKARYRKALSELYLRLGVWTGAMEILRERVPPGAFPKEEAFQKAQANLYSALSLEPLNPDCHLALGHLEDVMGLSSSGAEYETATQIAPHNAGLRYAVAIRYLLTGRKKEALEHAEALAAMDDSYVVPESPAKKLILERRAPSYISRLESSYLMKALDLGWRASNHDIGVVRNLVPAGDEAWEVWRLFREKNGLDG